MGVQEKEATSRAMKDRKVRATGKCAERYFRQLSGAKEDRNDKQQTITTPSTQSQPSEKRGDNARAYTQSLRTLHQLHRVLGQPCALKIVCARLLSLLKPHDFS